MTHSNTNFSREGQTYQSPSLNLLDIRVEGILCTSDGVDANPDPDSWKPGQEDWFE